MNDVLPTRATATPAERYKANRALASAIGVPMATSPMVVGLAGLTDYMPLFLLLGFVGLVILLAGWKGLSVNKRLFAAGFVALMLGLAFVPLIASTPQLGGTPQPPVGPAPEWEIILQATRSTSRDAATEMFDSQGGDGDGETPAGTLCAYGTNALLDANNRILVQQITVDDDVATSAAGYSAADICSFDFSFRLVNPQDANGDGTMDSVSIFGRVRSISATVTEDGNGSSSRRNIFYRDNTFGWYLGWSRDVDTINTDGQWISVAPSGVDDSQLGTAYGWQNLGSNAGADEDYATFAYVYRNYGPYGFTLPAAAFVYTMVVDIGTPGGYTTVTISTQLAARA